MISLLTGTLTSGVVTTDAMTQTMLTMVRAKVAVLNSRRDRDRTRMPETTTRT